MICTFFGHHDCPDAIKPELERAIKMQIEKGTKQFYVGNHGQFDAMVLSCLRSLKQQYPDLYYAVVLAFFPVENNLYRPEETVFPTGIENVPRRFAIDYRNRWMLDQADTVISYCNRSSGGAAKYVQKAEKKGITVINLYKR